MVQWDEVHRLAIALPEVVRRPERNDWRIRDRSFVFERPLRRADYEALGDEAPQGAILAAWVEDLGVKEALLADAPQTYFTTPHFDGYRLVLVRLDRIDPAELTELVVEAWLARAPKRLAAQYLDAHGLEPSP